MTIRYVCGAVTAVVLTCGVVTVAHADPQRDASLLPPDQSGVITIAGCLQPYGKHGDDYALSNVILGPVAGVQETTCSAGVDSRSIDLDDTHKAGLDPSMFGHWVEVTGRLEKEMSKDPNNLRELGIQSFRMLPVIPQRAEAAPAPVAPPQIEQQPAAPTADATAPAETKPVATSGQAPASLPKTASQIPAIGLLGLFALAGGLVLRWRRLPERG